GQARLARGRRDRREARADARALRRARPRPPRREARERPLRRERRAAARRLRLRPRRGAGDHDSDRSADRHAGVLRARARAGREELRHPKVVLPSRVPIGAIAGVTVATSAALVGALVLALRPPSPAVEPSRPSSPAPPTSRTTATVATTKLDLKKELGLIEQG